MAYINKRGDGYTRFESQAAAVLICRPLQRFNASRFAPAHSVGFDQGVISTHASAAAASSRSTGTHCPLSLGLYDTPYSASGLGAKLLFLCIFTLMKIAESLFVDKQT